MTQEEKAKAYDNIIEKANKMHSENCEACQMCIEELIPELKESDDERIRKVLLDFLENELEKHGNEEWDGCFHTTDVIAWLEKQGNLMGTLQEANKKVGELVEENYYLKEQDEQKPNDKVEPKFKVGDWVVDNNGIVKQILSYKDGVYKHTDGYSATIFEDEWRMWDITKDAKDGDVLSWDNSKCIALFKNIYDKDTFNSHGRVGHCTGIFEPRQAYHDTEGAHPATKEQRELLFKKMHDAGYEWDAEKKELKKIEQKPVVPKFRVGDKVKHGYLTYTVESILEDSYKMTAYGEDGHKGCTEHLTIGHEDGYELVEQNPAWSEEDENHVKSILSTIECCKAQFPNAQAVVEAYNADIEWLNSLRPQTTWKPSDEQIEALHDTIIYVKDSMFPSKNVLKKLYGQLKKLKEE